MQPIEKTFDCELKEFSEKERTFTAIASTESVDREGDILRSNGWKLKNYRKNPVVLWSHDASSLPIAKSKDVRIEEKKLKFRPQFATAEQNPFAEQVWQMFKTGFLRAFSVRFDPIVWEDIKQDDDNKQDNFFYRPPREFKSMELLEISAVIVPANPEATKSFISKIWKGMTFPKDYDFSEELKDKYEKIEELKRSKELKVVDATLNKEIKTLEEELENDNVIESLTEKISTLQVGITSLAKK